MYLKIHCITSCLNLSRLSRYMKGTLTIKPYLNPNRKRTQPTDTLFILAYHVWWDTFIQTLIDIRFLCHTALTTRFIVVRWGTAWKHKEMTNVMHSCTLAMRIEIWYTTKRSVWQSITQPSVSVTVNLTTLQSVSMDQSVANCLCHFIFYSLKPPLNWNNGLV